MTVSNAKQARRAHSKSTLRSGRVFGALASAAVVLVPGAAAAQEMQDYRVQQGDTCPSIAQRLYGDVGRIDVIHQNNPGLGRLPHRLRPGQILRLPRTATGPAPSSTARVSFVRNEVNAFTPEQHRARRDEALSRGHRLGTLDQSSAEVTFIDETQLQLEENTLVVVLGRAAQRLDAGNASETRLERGTLRASLAALAGGATPQRPAQVTVQTPSATAQVGAGSSLVNVDARASTRLSVHQGASSIRAAGRTVAVNEGFGSRADRGRAPRPPQPLPARPVWSAVFAPLVLVDSADSTAENARVAVSARYARGAGGPAPVVWHVQLARDDRFNDLLVDARVPAAVTNLDARLGPGVYHARVAAVDADGFEGRPSEVSVVRVAAVALDAGGPGRRASIAVTRGTFCSIDGAPLALVSGAIELSPLRAHTLRCAVDANGRGAIERSWGPAQSGIVTVRARALGAEYDGPRGSRRVLVGVYDALGQPVTDAPIRARAPRSITLEPLRPTATRGVYETVVRWSGAASAGELAVFVGDSNNPSATLALDASAPPEVAPVAPPPRPHVGLELAFAGDAMVTFDPRFRTGLGASLDARARIPAGPGLLLGARAGYLRFGCSGPVTTDVNVFCPPVTAATMSAPRTAVGIDTFDLGLQVGAYLARHNAPLTGYVTFVPQWIFQRTSVVRADGTEVVLASSTFSALAMAGAQLRIGPGGLFANLGYRGAIVDSSLGRLPIGGLLFSMGYRALF